MADVWIWIAVVFLILIVGISIGVFAYFKLKPSGGGGGSNCNTQQWNSDCTYYLEKYADSTITAPTQPLYLGSFAYSKGAGPALCQPMWYAFRYVRESDGGYGPLSAWTTLPIFAGSCNLPCAPSVCGTVLVPPNGNSQASVTYNAPQIVTTSPLDYPLFQPPGNYVANLHRYVGTNPPPPGTVGTVVGMLQPVFTSSYGFTSQLVDVAYPPTPNGGTTCNPQTCPT